ncbi:phosphotransferase [Gordonia sp. L191]|uniref:phosphotransferase n=1 Tax=Gordonia sp. L191 TaxID=2982699 RepID=UPI0024C00753|nr:phosphotransferase [Gordonia sp. L191]WHU47433.1 phosphotransferase [Gordonia sp. L191]
MKQQLDMLGSVARVSAARATERVTGLKPVIGPHEVPASVDQLTPEWLGATVGHAVPGARVTDMALGDGSDGTSSRRAISVEWNAAGSTAGLPTALYTKSTPSLLNRLLVGITGAAGAEALFYTRIRPTLDIGAPEGYHGAWDPKTCRSMVVTENIATSRGATFADASQIYIDRPSAESMVAELARYHGQLWDDPRLTGEWDLMPADQWQRSFNARIGFDRGATFAMRFLDEEIPVALQSKKKDIRRGLMQSVTYDVSGPMTLLHQDVHPGNWFRLPDGSLNLYDWQGIGCGGWALDVSYALSTALTTEDRREWERDLLALYLERLAAEGGKPPTEGEAFLAYRQQMFRGFIYWTYTHLVGKFSELQPDAHVRALVQRTGQALVDLESLDSLDRPPRW